MPFCPVCGKEVLSDSRFCPNCGRELGGASTLAPQQGSPSQPTSSSRQVPTRDVGHRELMIALWILGIVGIVILEAHSTWAYLVVIAADLASVEAVYEDAKAINRFSGKKTLDETLWSLLVLVLWIVAIPFYVFSRREEALRETRD